MMRRAHVALAEFSLLLASLALVGCHRRYAPPENFVQVARDEASGRVYYYNPQSVVRDKGFVDFDYLQVESNDERVEGRMETNCEEQAQRLSGAYYSRNGSLWLRMPHDPKPAPAPPGSDYARLIARPCQQAAERAHFAGAYSVEAAMKSIFGAYDGKDKSSPWNEVEADVAGVERPVLPARARFIYDAPYTQHGVAKHLLVTAVKTIECQACAAAVGVFVFAQQSGEWRMELERHNLSVGSWGAPPKGMKLMQIGPEAYALFVSDEYEGGGEKTSAESLYLLGEGELPQIFAVQSSNDNHDGMCGVEPKDYGPCAIDKAAWKFLPGENADFYDIQLERTKTVNGHAPVLTRERYAFHGLLYDLVKP